MRGLDARGRGRALTAHAYGPGTAASAPWRGPARVRGARRTALGVDVTEAAQTAHVEPSEAQAFTRVGRLVTHRSPRDAPPEPSWWRPVGSGRGRSGQRNPRRRAPEGVEAAGARARRRGAAAPRRAGSGLVLQLHQAVVPDGLEPAGAYERRSAGTARRGCRRWPGRSRRVLPGTAARSHRDDRSAVADQRAAGACRCPSPGTISWTMISAGRRSRPRAPSVHEAGPVVARHASAPVA